MQQTNRLEEACTVFQETIRQQPHHQTALMSLATSLHSLGRLEEALPHYESSVKLSPNNTLLLQNFVILLKNMGKYQYASDVVDVVVELLPDDNEAIQMQSSVKKLLQGKPCCHHCYCCCYHFTSHAS